MNPFYHKLSKYLVVLNYYRFHLIARPEDAQGKKFIKQIESISRYGMEAVVSGRDISYLSAQNLENLCEDINNKIWYNLDRGGDLMRNLSVEDASAESDAAEALIEVFPFYKDHSLDVALLYQSSGRFYNKVWEPVQHCTSNFEYFQNEEKRARNLILSGLAITLISLLAIMFWVNTIPIWLSCSLVLLSSLIFAASLKQLSFVNSIGKRIIRSTRDEINENSNSIIDMCKKIIKWFEVTGLFLLLAAFGWQCLDEHSKQAKMEGYFYETNEKLYAIWEGVYDEALHSDRYHGNATVAVNYDSFHAQFKDWNQVKEGMETLDHQSKVFFWIRVVLYVLGSFLIIVSKWPKTTKDRD